MKDWNAWVWFAVIAGSVAAIYGLHRLLLRLEARGYVYYLHKKPTSGMASSCIALQEFIEPDVKHVYQVKEQKRQRGEAKAPGEGEDRLPKQ